MIYAFGEFELDEAACELRRAGEHQPLEPKAHDLLLHLVRNRERLVTKHELLETLWPDTAVSESSLTRAVNLARAAVGDSGHDQRVIQTLSGRGYRFIAPAEIREAGAPRTPNRRRARVAGAGVVTMLTIAVILLWASWPAPLAMLLGAAGLRPPPSNPPLPDRPSVVVLPFADLSPNGSQAHLVDGFTDDLTFEVGRFAGLFVIARSSAFTYRGRDRRVNEIAQELGVRYAVEGSLRVDGERVVVSAQLVDAETERQIWRGRFDRKMGGLFDIQSEISREVAAALGVRIRDAELARLRGRPDGDLDAYQLVVRGLSHWWHLTRSDQAEARAFFRRAIDVAPGYARAHALLAASLAANYGMGWDPDPRHIAEARRLARRAVELDPELATAYAALAGAELWGGDPRAAVQAADRAVELGPNNDMCHGIRAMSLAAKGQPIDAIASLNQALRLNPRHPAPYWMLLGYFYELTGRSDDAYAIWERVRAANPDMILPRLELAQAYEADGRHEKARKLVGEILSTSPHFDSEIALRLDPNEQSEEEARRQSALLERAGLPAPASAKHQNTVRLR